jgi:hypothetical protein
MRPRRITYPAISNAGRSFRRGHGRPPSPQWQSIPRRFAARQNPYKTDSSFQEIRNAGFGDTECRSASGAPGGSRRRKLHCRSQKALGCATSAISYAIDTLERDLGLSLFDRGATRKPKLIQQVEAIVSAMCRQRRSRHPRLRSTCRRAQSFGTAQSSSSSPYLSTSRECMELTQVPLV